MSSLPHIPLTGAIRVDLPVRSLRLRPARPSPAERTDEVAATALFDLHVRSRVAGGGCTYVMVAPPREMTRLDAKQAAVNTALRLYLERPELHGHDVLVLNARGKRVAIVPILFPKQS